MNKPNEVDQDIENEDNTIGADIIQPAKYSVSKALDISHVKELLRITRIKSKEDDAKAIPAFEAAQSLFREKRYTEALKKYIEAALSGHLKSQRRLGVMYLEGLGCRKDYISALKWLKVAAERNDLHAQEQLAKMYRLGLGTEENLKIAVYWYHRSSKLGGVQSTFELATCYEQGLGVIQDSDEAIRLFMIASDQGHAGARYHVGMAYECGLGLEQDVQEAIDWYILAIHGNNYDAKIRFWALVDEGTFLPETSEEAKFAEGVGLSLGDPICQLKEAFRLMIGYDRTQDFEYFERIFYLEKAKVSQPIWKSVLWECYNKLKDLVIEHDTCSNKPLKSQSSNNTQQSKKLTWLFTEFFKSKQKLIEAFDSVQTEYDCPWEFKYFERIISHNSIMELPNSLINEFWDSYEKAKGALSDRDTFSKSSLEHYLDLEVGLNIKSRWLLSDFYNINQDSIGKIYSLSMYACLGICDAQHELGLIYSDGEKCDQDIEKAIFWFKMAAAQGNRDAYRELGYIFFRNAIGDNFKKLSVAFLEEAVKLGCPKAMHTLAYKYLSGDGVEGNEEEYWNLVTTSVNLGCVEAMYDLSRKCNNRFFSIVKNCEGHLKEKLQEFYYWFEDYLLIKCAIKWQPYAMIEFVRSRVDVLGLEPSIYDFLSGGLDIENSEANTQILAYQAFSSNGVDERILNEIIQLYELIEKTEPVDAITDLIFLHSREKLRASSNLTKIEENISRFLGGLNSNRKKLEDILLIIEEEVFMREGLVENQNFQSLGADQQRERFKNAIERREVTNLEKWEEKIKILISNLGEHSFAKDEIEKICVDTDSRRRRIEEKRSKEQEVSDIWYD